MSEREKKQISDQSRREFLRKSVYAACATPIVLSMLVEKASACKSWEMNEPVKKERYSFRDNQIRLKKVSVRSRKTIHARKR